MSIAFDPQQTTEFRLAEAESGPVFVTRYLTVRQVMQCEDLTAQAWAARTRELAPEEPDVFAALARNRSEWLRLLTAAAMLGLTDWRDLRDAQGAAVPFAADGAPLADVLTPSELEQVVRGKLQAVQLGEDGRKKSAPPSPLLSATAPTSLPSSAGSATATA